MIHVFLTGLRSAVDMPQNTSSSHWREQGNGIYVTARDNLCPSVRKERLRQAASCYYKAFNFSTNEDEKVVVDLCVIRTCDIYLWMDLRDGEVR